jgi:hypothetical protein
LSFGRYYLFVGVDKHLILVEMDSVTYCIFCRAVTKDEPIEHIAPEGLVGEPFFDVTYFSITAPSRKLLLDSDEVCRPCNRCLGKLDSYLIDQCGFLRALWNQTGTKSGKPATAQRPGMFAYRGQNGPEVVLNSTSRPVITPGGHKAMPSKSHPLAVSVTGFNVGRGIGEVSFVQPMRLNKKVMRAIHKIAFELLCFQKGPALVLEDQFDGLREYILKGKGSRSVIITTAAAAGEWERPCFGLEYQDGWPGWLATIRLGPTFWVDLTPGNDFVTRTDIAELHRNGMAVWSDQGGGTFSVSQN